MLGANISASKKIFEKCQNRTLCAQKALQNDSRQSSSSTSSRPWSTTPSRFIVWPFGQSFCHRKDDLYGSSSDAMSAVLLRKRFGSQGKSLSSEMFRIMAQGKDQSDQ